MEERTRAAVMTLTLKVPSDAERLAAMAASADDPDFSNHIGSGSLLKRTPGGSFLKRGNGGSSSGTTGSGGAGGVGSFLGKGGSFRGHAANSSAGAAAPVNDSAGREASSPLPLRPSAAARSSDGSSQPGSGSGSISAGRPNTSIAMTLDAFASSLVQEATNVPPPPLPPAAVVATPSPSSLLFPTGIAAAPSAEPEVVPVLVGVPAAAGVADPGPDDKPARPTSASSWQDAGLSGLLFEVGLGFVPRINSIPHARV